MAVKPRMRKIVVRLLLVFGSLLFTVLLAEGALRVTGYEPLYNPIGPRFLFRDDPDLGIRLRSGFEGTHRHPEFEVPVQISSMGFRDREFGPKREGTFRILSLGDSFAYGYGVELADSYAKLLETHLNAGADGPVVEVINGAAPSYSTRQMAVLVDNVVDELQPDLVIFTFLHTDDLDGNQTLGLRERGGLVLTPFFADQVDGSFFNRFAVDYSNVMLLFRLKMMEWESGVDLSTPPDLSQGADHVPYPEGVHLLVTPSPDDVLAKWRVADEWIERLASRAKEAGARVCLFNISFPFQFDDESWQRALDRYTDIDGDSIDREMIADRLREICTRLDIELFDPGAGTPATSLTEEDFFPANRHFTASGHAKYAELLAEFLVARNLIR